MAMDSLTWSFSVSRMGFADIWCGEHKEGYAIVFMPSPIESQTVSSAESYTMILTRLCKRTPIQERVGNENAV